MTTKHKSENPTALSHGWVPADLKHPYSPRGWDPRGALNPIVTLSPNNYVKLSPRFQLLGSSLPQLGESGRLAADGGDAGSKAGMLRRKLPHISRRAGGLTLR